MSHTTSIKGIVIQDVAALKSAVKEMAKNGIKIELAEDATPRAYYSNQQGLGKAAFVLKLADAKYDVGLYASKDASGKTVYEARTDFWGGSVENVLGVPAKSPEQRDQAKLGKFFQMYGLHAVEGSLRSQGKMFQRTTDKDGRIKLTVPY